MIVSSVLLGIWLCLPFIEGALMESSGTFDSHPWLFCSQ